MLLTAVIPIFPASCVDGDDDEPVSKLQRIWELTGLSGPIEAETPETQQERSSDIFACSDSLIVNTMDPDRGNADIPMVRLLTQCTVTEPLISTADTAELADIGVRLGTPAAIRSLHGITLIRKTLTHDGADLAGVGAWLKHSSFAIRNDNRAIEGNKAVPGTG